MTDIFNFFHYLEEHIDWSKKTFGESYRLKGLIKHIQKELVEIEEKPHDLSEWIDVIILAIDGAWRSGYSSQDIVSMLENKQKINFKRIYPFPTNDDEPSEHMK